MQVEAATYLLEVLNNLSVEDFSKTFNMMLQQERVKQLSSGVSMGGYSLSTLLKLNSIVKLDNTSYRSLCKSGAFNIPTASFNRCFNCDARDHGVGSSPHNKYQEKIAENKKNFIKMKQIQGGSGGGKTWDNRSNNRGRTNKYQKQQKSDNRT